MRGTLTIAGKDIRNMFVSPLFYVISALCSVLWSVMYIQSLGEFDAASRQAMMMGQQNGEGGPNVHFQIFAKHISLTNFMLILAIAALTMRLLSEEKKQRSFDLLLTSPVTATEIVLGKFIAGLAVAWGLVLISFIYPLSVAAFAPIDWGPLLAAYMGMCLLTACYVAIGIFASSLTENQVLAVVMALIFSVGLWFIGSAANSAEGDTARKIFEHLAVSTHFVNFIKGTFSTASTVFFVSVAGFYVFLTQRVVESARWR